MAGKNKKYLLKLENITSEIDEDSYLTFNSDVIFENLYMMSSYIISTVL